MPQTRENLGPAERIINSLLTHSDHMIHNRPGMIVPDPASAVGVRWTPVTHKVEADGKKTVIRLDKIGNKTQKVEVGQMNGDLAIKAGRTVAGHYRPAGFFPEVAAWMYRQVAGVWQLDNEFAARWASYAFSQDHKDQKVVLAAFMLCQSRKGDPVFGEGAPQAEKTRDEEAQAAATVIAKTAAKILFYDDDFRDVGEAMCLLYEKAQKDKYLNAKLLLRIHDLLLLPQIAEINRELGFTRSARTPFMGRWPKVVQKYLEYREENPKLLKSAVDQGWRTSIMKLAQIIGYKPVTPYFFEVLRWHQKQASTGHRTISIGKEVKAAESWEGLGEADICQKIVTEKLNWKRIVGFLPREVGVTRAIVSAAIEAGSLSDKDLVILTPTLEELGLLQVPEIRARWEQGTKNSKDMRAANIALRVKSKDVQETLNAGAEAAMQKAVEEVIKNLIIYFIIDISGSMSLAIEQAMEFIARFLPAFPQGKIFISVFNQVGREVVLKHHSAEGVRTALKGFKASGGTSYGEGVRALAGHKPGKDEEALFLFVGDEQDSPFTAAVRQSGLNPAAFGLLKVGGYPSDMAVRTTAAELGIPCFPLDQGTIQDIYELPRTLRALIAATPVQKRAEVPQMQRETLVDVILKTELLQKPVWAS